MDFNPAELLLIKDEELENDLNAVSATSTPEMNRRSSTSKCRDPDSPSMGTSLVKLICAF
jgi:hypothetical protein